MKKSYTSIWFNNWRRKPIFLLTIVNESNIIIDTIQYTVCYTSPEGVKYGSRTYIKYDAALSPQKKITLSNPIKSDSDAQISIGKIVCTVKNKEV